MKKKNKKQKEEKIINKMLESINNTFKKTDFNIEKIDETTNEIMDMIRLEFKLNEDSDKDDDVYGFIHTKINELIKEITNETR